jgi:hypothetical protein
MASTLNPGLVPEFCANAHTPERAKPAAHTATKTFTVRIEPHRLKQKIVGATLLDESAGRT